MKFTNAKPILEMTRSEATIIYDFLTEVMRGESLNEVDYGNIIDDFVAQYEYDVDSCSESLMSFILKIKD